MYEVEVKVPAALDRVRDRLAELDAEPLGTVVQSDTYYDAPHRSFPETDEALRIREERPVSGRQENATEQGGDGIGDEVVDDVDVDDENADDESVARITYKGPLVGDESKTREEVETGVDSAAAADAIFRNLGFEPAATVRKERDRYSFDGYVVTLDAVDDVGEFVEVEREVTEAEIDAARNGAFDVLERLELDPDRQVQTSYLALSLADDE